MGGTSTSTVGCQSPTPEIVDRWAQDAWARRNDVDGHDLAEVAGTVAREGGTALSEHVLEHGMVAAGAMGGVVESHAKGDDLANRGSNCRPFA